MSRQHSVHLLVGVGVLASAFVSAGLVRSATPTAGDASAALGPRVVATISLPGKQPVATALYESGDRLFVADEVSGDLLTIDAATRRVVSSAHVGRDVSALVVNQGAGKVYAASDGGLGHGSGTISVVDARTGTLVKTIDPAPSGYAGQAGDFVLVNDERHGRVYASFFCVACEPLGVIDVATDRLTLVPQEIQWQIGGGLKGVNGVTNEVFAVGRRGLDDHASVLVIHGEDLRVESLGLPHSNEGWTDDVVVNDVDNKLYLFFSPIGAWSGLLILDRASGQYKSIVGPDRESTSPLVFDASSDTLFAGAGVNGTRGLIVAGATDKPTWVDFREGGMAVAGVRSATDNAYFATVSSGATFVLDGHSRQTLRLKTGKPSSHGGSVFSSLVIDQSRGLVYVVNDDHDGTIAVIQDGAVQLQQCVVPNVRGMPLAAAKRAIAAAGCRTGAVRTAYSAGVKKGHVISQQPRAGARLAQGAKVSLVLSKGKRRP